MPWSRILQSKRSIFQSPFWEGVIVKGVGDYLMHLFALLLIQMHSSFSGFWILWISSTYKWMLWGLIIAPCLYTWMFKSVIWLLASRALKDSSPLLHLGSCPRVPWALHLHHHRIRPLSYLFIDPYLVHWSHVICHFVCLVTIYMDIRFCVLPSLSQCFFLYLLSLSYFATKRGRQDWFCYVLLSIDIYLHAWLAFLAHIFLLILIWLHCLYIFPHITLPCVFVFGCIVLSSRCGRMNFRWALLSVT